MPSQRSFPQAHTFGGSMRVAMARKARASLVFINITTSCWLKKSGTPMDEKIALLIDQYNEVKAQNLAMNHALAGILSTLPKELRDAAARHYDLRCATFQVVVNDGRIELDALAIQREQFAKVRRQIFREPEGNQPS